MRRSRMPWARRFQEIVTIPCAGSMHRVAVTSRGALALFDHGRVEATALRAILTLGGQMEGCFQFVAALAGQGSWSDTASWAVRRADELREERRRRTCPVNPPPLSVEVLQRLLLKAGKAYETGNGAVLERIRMLMAGRW